MQDAKKSPKSRHLCTIIQLWAISSQLRHVSTTGKNLLSTNSLQMSLQYGELRPTSGWDRSGSWGTAANFNGLRILAALLHGSQVVSVVQTAALNRGRHLCSAGQPSRWALAHILVETWLETWCKGLSTWLETWPERLETWLATCP